MTRSTLSIGAAWASASRRTLTAMILLHLFCLLCEPAVSAQQLDTSDIVQIGAAGLPGVGLQVGYVDVGAAFTREAVTYVDLAPRFASNREELQVAAGLGAGIRIIGTLETLALITPRVWDVHLGFRFGPGLNFAAKETRIEKNQRFSLFLEPFARFTTSFRGSRVYFLEAGIQRPVFRVGMWLSL